MTEEATTVRSIFFDSPADAVSALATAVRSGAAGDGVVDALGRMPDAGKKAVLSEVGSAAAGILELGVQDIFGQAWGKYTALRRAAVATAADPGSEQIVELASHTLSFDHQPGVDVHIGDLPPLPITLHIQLTILVQGLVAVVRGGRLLLVRTGSCEATGTLTIAGRQVAERQLAVEFPLSLSFRDGIPLAEPSDR